MMLPEKAFDLVPDSLTGAVAAIEGIRDAAVLLNGPTGCKFYHGALSENQLPRLESIDPIYYSEEFYFGQPRVPATYLDDYDYVFGATEKLEKILPVVAAKGHRLIAIINTPGAALIGDDLLRFISQANLPVPCIAIENTGFSDTPASGFQQAIREALKIVPCQPEHTQQKSVNLAGISLFHHHWQGNVRELTFLLNQCGIVVNTVLCAGCSFSELGSLGRAEATISLYGEYADDLLPLVRENFQQTIIEPSPGIPIGFDATARWISEICDCLEMSPAPALATIKKKRMLAYRALSRFNSLTGLPKGASFGVQGEASFVLALTRWLYSYLGMVPMSIEITDTTPDITNTMHAFLQEINCPEVMDKEISLALPEVVFGSGALISRLRLVQQPFVGIETALPVSGYLHIEPKSFWGPGGALHLLEMILNGLAGYH